MTSNKNLSVHLQDFPDVSSIEERKDLVADMDLVRHICSAALFLRDAQNLRVRLPLSKLTVISPDPTIKHILIYQDIIAEEVNVKEVLVSNDFARLAEKKLQINFKKIGPKFGDKVKDITKAAKEGNWEEVKEAASKGIKIAGVFLEEGEYEIRLTTSDQNSIAAVQGRDCLVQLDLNLTPALEQEGLARDMVRFIQQHRKSADLNVSDHIKIKLYAPEFKEAIQLYGDYIKEQVLADEIILEADKERVKSSYNFEGEVEGSLVSLGFTVSD